MPCRRCAANSDRLSPSPTAGSPKGAPGEDAARLRGVSTSEKLCTGGPSTRGVLSVLRPPML
eukprot:9016395-Pyramimonas_sp.AAC.1